MPRTVSVNDRTVVHKASEGFATGFPDVCKTPPSHTPIPYGNVAISRDAAATCTTIFCDGHAVMNKASYLATSYSDEPGTDGGIISGCNQGKATFVTYSPDVLFEGQPVPRHMDVLMGNHGSPGNVVLPRWIQNLKNAAAAHMIVCVIICNCYFNMGSKMECFHRSMGDRPPAGPKTAWDPHFSGIYIETTFRNGEVVYGGTSSRWTDSRGEPLPLPYSERMPGTDRPDVVVARDPQRPLTQSNVAAIYEVKFPGDDEDREQNDRYKKLLPAGAAPYQVLTPEGCGCKRKITDLVLHALPKVTGELKAPAFEPLPWLPLGPGLKPAPTRQPVFGPGFLPIILEPEDGWVGDKPTKEA